MKPVFGVMLNEKYSSFMIAAAVVVALMSLSDVPNDGFEALDPWVVWIDPATPVPVVNRPALEFGSESIEAVFRVKSYCAKMSACTDTAQRSSATDALKIRFIKAGAECPFTPLAGKRFPVTSM